ncbi:MAG TPA: DUF4363 family protein [Clostridia bacterium]|nr:DUF4363 family protein [Clostridia bacterium]
MKRFYIALVVLVVMFSGCFWLNFKMQHGTLTMKDEIDRIGHAVETGDPDSAKATMQQLTELWTGNKHFFRALAGSTYCDPFESTMERASVWLEQDKKSELFAELSELHSRIDQLWDTQALHPQNFW